MFKRKSICNSYQKKEKDNTNSWITALLIKKIEIDLAKRPNLLTDLTASESLFCKKDFNFNEDTSFNLNRDQWITANYEYWLKLVKINNLINIDKWKLLYKEYKEKTWLENKEQMKIMIALTSTIVI